MKKILSLVIALAFIFSIAAPIMAAEFPKSIDKLMKGTEDVVKSPFVIYDHSKKEMDANKHKSIGLLKGLVESPFHMIKKAGGGLIDVATFPVE